MIELRPTRIIIISFYCFLVGLFLFSVTANTISSSNGASNLLLWLPVSAALAFAAVFIAVGIGILYYNQLCWKILLFLLIIFIANVVSIMLVVLVFFCFDVTHLYQYYQSIHISFFTGFSFSSIFLLGIFVLYHLTLKDTVNYFGEMGELAKPF